ncbi:MAG: glycosyltransferase, partial [Cyanobium sp.]
PVLFVDGGSPPAVRDVLQRSAEQWGFELLRREAFISANQARLLALERLSVSYLLCVENDVRLAPGCAEAVVAAAERQRADVVVPLVLEENDRGRQRIHLAGGSCRQVLKECGDQSFGPVVTVALIDNHTERVDHQRVACSQICASTSS